jgi:hypothetical protein
MNWAQATNKRFSKNNVVFHISKNLILPCIHGQNKTENPDIGRYNIIDIMAHVI